MTACEMILELLDKAIMEQVDWLYYKCYDPGSYYDAWLRYGLGYD